jgi:hypothetical protein
MNQRFTLSFTFLIALLNSSESKAMLTQAAFNAEQNQQNIVQNSQFSHQSIEEIKSLLLLSKEEFAELDNLKGYLPALQSETKTEENREVIDKIRMNISEKEMQLNDFSETITISLAKYFCMEENISTESIKKALDSKEQDLAYFKSFYNLISIVESKTDYYIRLKETFNDPHHEQHLFAASIRGVNIIDIPSKNKHRVHSLVGNIRFRERDGILFLLKFVSSLNLTEKEFSFVANFTNYLRWDASNYKEEYFTFFKNIMNLAHKGENLFSSTSTEKINSATDWSNLAKKLINTELEDSNKNGDLSTDDYETLKKLLNFRKKDGEVLLNAKKEIRKNIQQEESKDQSVDNYNPRENDVRVFSKLSYYFEKIINPNQERNIDLMAKIEQIEHFTPIFNKIKEKINSDIATHQYSGERLKEIIEGQKLLTTLNPLYFRKLIIATYLVEIKGQTQTPDITKL